MRIVACISMGPPSPGAPFQWRPRAPGSPCKRVPPLRQCDARHRQTRTATARLPAGLRPAHRCSGGGGVYRMPSGYAAAPAAAAHRAAAASASATGRERPSTQLVLNGAHRRQAAWHGYAVPAPPMGPLPVACRFADRSHAARFAEITWHASFAALPSSPCRSITAPRIPSRVTASRCFAALDGIRSAEEGQARGGRRGWSSIWMQFADTVLHPCGKISGFLIFALSIHLFAYHSRLWPSCWSWGEWLLLTCG